MFFKSEHPEDRGGIGGGEERRIAIKGLSPEQLDLVDRLVLDRRRGV
ncbi:MAG: hypothetical protein O7J95_11400 [Planctomycetota bacterium]|nr:hypothetical protein [Planctomycetota bacterium]